MLELMNVNRYFGGVKLLNEVDPRLSKRCVYTLIRKQWFGEDNSNQHNFWLFVNRLRNCEIQKKEY